MCSEIKALEPVMPGVALRPGSGSLVLCQSAHILGPDPFRGVCFTAVIAMETVEPCLRKWVKHGWPPPPEEKSTLLTFNKPTDREGNSSPRKDKTARCLGFQTQRPSTPAPWFPPLIHGGIGLPPELNLCTFSGAVA
ncbi:hypothetical protein SKAU_G00419680 [Synaphobranchus kaupii]|uniref:Uncharacterized protein n=1 Tax=Synaphobranchus kaupii TaxID=118154 RepID=A0A9Q1E6E5_SYNKA|nr:hypothetical protein SKAU_G00419680 [Synaphobranchus kaupii]